MRGTPTTPLVGAVVVGNLAVGHVRRPVLGGAAGLPAIQGPP